MSFARIGGAGERVVEEPARVEEAAAREHGPALQRGLGNRIVRGGSLPSELSPLAGRSLRVARALAADAGEGTHPGAWRTLGNRATAAQVRRTASRATMTVEAADDPGEHEADRVADQVVRAIEGSGSASATPTIGRISRSSAALARAAEEGPSHGPEGGAVDAGVERQILAASGGGSALDEAIRGPMERSFGVDLGRLRVHTGPQADSLSRSLHARAFTVGSDIFFRSGAYEPRSAAGRRLLAHEVTHSIQQGAVAAPGAAVAVQRSLMIQRDYAGLDDLGKARVDAKADAEYAKKAEEYEYKLGLKLSTCTPASQITDELLGRVKKIVDAWAEATGRQRQKEAVYAQEFAFDEGDKYYGAFEMTGAAVKKVFEHLDVFGKHQPMRKRLKVIYNAVRNNNLAKWLKVAADNLTEEDRVTAARLGGDLTATAKSVMSVSKTTAARGANGALDLAGVSAHVVAPTFAQSSGLRDVLKGDDELRDRVTQASAREKHSVDFNQGTPQAFTAPTHVAAPDMWSSIARGTPDEAAQIDAANKDRLYSQNKGVDWADQHTLQVGDVTDLTAHEIQLLRRRAGLGGGVVKKGVKTAFKGRVDDKIQWEQGREAISVMVNSPVEKAASDIAARLEAGISGSANMMYAASKNLGVTDLLSLKKLRLAMLGWMLPNHDHSFYEIMKAAEIQGVPFVVDPARPGYQYEAPENFDPLEVAPLQSLLTERKFPGYYLSAAHKNKLAGEIEAAAQQDQDDHIESEDTVPKYRVKVEALGLPRATAQALPERHLVEIIALAAEVHRAGLKDESIGDDATKEKNRAGNLLRLRHIREGSSYRYLVHADPARAELWLAQLLIHQNKPTLLDHRLLAAVDTARLPALGANAAARAKVLTDIGVPASMLNGLGEHVINDLVQLQAIVSALQLDQAKTVVEDPNRAEYAKLFQTQTWGRVAQMVGNNVLWVMMLRIFRHHHGAKVAGSIWSQQAGVPQIKAAIDAGVPESMALRMDPNAANDIAVGLVAAIDTILTHDIAVRVAELKQLRADKQALGDYIDGTFGLNRFDMIVATIALRKGIDISRDVHLRTLGRMASVLRTSGPIDSPDQAATGFQDQGLRWAKDQVVQNLGTEHKAFAGSAYEALTPVEIASIGEYCKLGGMGYWQDALTRPDTKDKGKYGAVKVAAKMQAAVAGLRKLPVYAGPVYNGQRSDLKGRPEVAMQVFAVGTVHPQDNFFSTAKEVDASFIVKADPGVAWVIEHVRTGRDVSYLSQNFHEKEVLFAPGARFIVTRVEDRTDLLRFPDGHGKVWVYVDEL